MTVRDRDRGAKALVARSGKRAKVRVGLIGSRARARNSGSVGTTIADIGTFHEFGIGVARRSFIAGYADEAEPKNKKRMRNVVKRIAQGHPVSATLEVFGSVVTNEMKDRISDGISPGLAQATIRRKKSSTPLIDTGQLRSSITYVVEADDG